MENLSEEPVAAMPRLNEPAPDFVANTSQGLKKLGDYKGKWLVLFSHPVDFTPVCTTECMASAKAADQFQALNCELLGLSIDSNYAHLAWVQNIKEKFGVDIPPGYKVIVPPPGTVEDAERRLEEGYECTDWYFLQEGTLRPEARSKGGQRGSACLRSGIRAQAHCCGDTAQVVE